MKKYFEFSGTISGTNYFLRNLIATGIAFIAGFLIGLGISLQEYNGVFVFLGSIIIAPTFWFNATTVYKRANALYPNEATAITIGIFVLQFLSQLVPLLGIGSLIAGLILIFKNSNIEQHNG